MENQEKKEKKYTGLVIGYVSVMAAVVLFSFWGGCTGPFLPTPSDQPRSLRKESIRQSAGPGRTGPRARRRYFWPHGGVHGGK